MATKHNGILKLNEAMSRHTSWRIGGIADQFYLPESVTDLALFLKSLAVTENIVWVGLGSNLLVRDAGIRGTVICTSGVLNEINFIENKQVTVEAGVACPKIAKKCAEQALSGIEFLSGIPGTIGGALNMNAGALGHEIWEFVVEVEMLTRQGEIRKRSKDDFDISYRQVSGKDFELGVDEWFVSGTFKLISSEEVTVKEKIKEILRRRGATQPTQLANAGSVFRNPDGHFAAKLIEDAGLKGFCIGGACVSEKHANFFINTGSASSNDVEALIKYVSDLIYKEHNIRMIVEVKVIGDKS
ncbi:MAG: UDP-N-acetylmuramate dehydrogenase [Gammaproteobacteria bacterium]